MANATTPLHAKIQTLTTQAITDALFVMEKPWDDFSGDERTVRAELLGAYEERCGEDAVDALMDRLEEAAARLAAQRRPTVLRDVLLAA